MPARPPVHAWRVRHVVETGSTNTDLVAAARDGEPGGLVLMADVQTAGRGRLGRTWTAPPGGSLLCSILVRLPDAQVPVHRFTQWVAIAAAQACERVAGVVPALKWPNDLLVDDRKLAGVLAEAVVVDGTVAAVVVGIGLNVAWGDDLPAELADIATTLERCGGRPCRPVDVLDALLAELDALGLDDVPVAYRSRLATLGREVRVVLAGDELVGRAAGVDDEGRLAVDDASGVRHWINAGDVVHLRASPPAPPTASPR